MIQKLKEHDVIDTKTDKVIGTIACDLPETIDKMNEVIDAVNEFQKILHDVVNESVKNMSWVDTLENTVLELRAKVNKLAPNKTKQKRVMVKNRKFHLQHRNKRM